MSTIKTFYGESYGYVCVVVCSDISGAEMLALEISGLWDCSYARLRT